MPTDLTVVAVAVSPGRVRLVVSGELDLGSVAALRGSVTGALTLASRRLDLDLGGVDFLDATGLGALLWCHRRARAAGAACHVVAASAPVERMLRLTGTRAQLVGLAAAATPA